MSKKLKDLLQIALFYAVSYGLALIPCFWIGGTFWKVLVFDLLATVFVFVFSVIKKNSSVYDPYWSLTPQLIALWLFFTAGRLSVWQILFLIAFNLWALRLTGNWIAVFTDFSYEDWRYRKYRAENPPFLFFFINFFGIHLVPTLVVFAGMLPLFELAENPLGPLALPGILVVLFGVSLEFLADRDMHAFLASVQEKAVCRRGLWNYSRHPNYLGEMSVWTGVFLTMIFYAPEKWYCCVGPAAVILLFNTVSIPLAEHRQLSRRPEYAAYQKVTSRCLLLPHKRRAEK